MAKPIASITVACPKCDDDLIVPITWKTSPVHKPGEVRISAAPDLSILKTHLMLHLPSGPGPHDGLPIAS